MTIDPNDLINSILASLSRVDFIKAEDIPNIDLYMDQVTTFMEQQLNKSRRYPDDKIMTKTMINNYAKNKLIPPPAGKKYTKQHILLLAFIYYFKNLLSISDIDKLLTPLYGDDFTKNIPSGLSLEDIYKSVFSLEKNELDVIVEDITRRFAVSQEMFPEVEGLEGEHLRYFTFICMLSFDVYIKKMIIENLIDLLPDTINTPKLRKSKK